MRVSDDWMWLAWARWTARVPSHWRPLRVEANGGRGKLMVGDSTQAIAQLKWSYPSEKDFDAEGWIEKRVRSLKGEVAPAKNAPARTAFDETRWLPEVHMAKGAISSVWCGYSAAAGLALEIVLNGAVPDEVRRASMELFLPSLGVCALDAPTRWSVFDVSFESPPGYVLHGKRLDLGNLRLELAKGKRLLRLGQVYPGVAALAKSPMANWLTGFTTPGRRHLQGDEKAQPFEREGMKGLEYLGVKRFAFPLGGVAPRHMAGAVVHDEQLDRILLAVHESPGKEEGELVYDALRRMNWARTEREF